MAIFIDGFDFWDSGSGSYLTNANIYNSINITTMQAGVYGYGQSMLSDGFRQVQKPFSSISIGASPATNWPTIYTCFHIRQTSANNNLRIFNLRDAGGGAVQLRFNFTSGNLMNVYRGENTTLLATGTKVFTLGVWYWVAVKIVISNTVGVVQTKVDNVDDINLTGADTCANANEYADQFDWFNQSGAANIWIDNWHLYNGADAAPWNAISTVERRVYFFMPNADGTPVDWTASAGADWQCIDEIPPNGDTDYIKSSTVGNITVVDKANVSGIATINFVQVMAGARRDDAVARGFKIVAKDVGGTYAKSSEYALTASYTYYLMGWLQDPVAVSAWTPTNFDAYTFGVELTS